MVNRRSLSDAMTLSDAQSAFINGGSVPQVEPLKPSLVPAAKVVASPEIEDEPIGQEREAEEPDANSREARSSTRRPRARQSSEQETSEDPILRGFAKMWVPLTTKLQPTTAAALKRAGLEQKLAGKEPSSVQEIVEIAVHAWLKQQKYL